MVKGPSRNKNTYKLNAVPRLHLQSIRLVGDWVKFRTSRKQKFQLFGARAEALKLGVTKCLTRQLFCFLYRTDRQSDGQTLRLLQSVVCYYFSGSCKLLLPFLFCVLVFIGEYVGVRVGSEG